MRNTGEQAWIRRDPAAASMLAQRERREFRMDYLASLAVDPAAWVASRRPDDADEGEGNPFGLTEEQDAAIRAAMASMGPTAVS